MHLDQHCCIVGNWINSYIRNCRMFCLRNRWSRQARGSNPDLSFPHSPWPTQVWWPAETDDLSCQCPLVRNSHTVVPCRVNLLFFLFLDWVFCCCYCLLLSVSVSVTPTCMHLCTHTHTCNLHVLARTHRHTHARTHTHTCTCTRARTHLNTSSHAHTLYTHLQSYMYIF